MPFEVKVAKNLPLLQDGGLLMAILQTQPSLAGVGAWLSLTIGKQVELTLVLFWAGSWPTWSEKGCTQSGFIVVPGVPVAVNDIIFFGIMNISLHRYFSKIS